MKWNHGAALLSACCRNVGIETEIVPAGPELLEEIKDADVVAFSFVTDEDYEKCLPFMRLALDQEKLVICGGVYARRGGRIDESLCHYICRGEGEILPSFILHGDTYLFDEKYHHADLDVLPAPDLTGVTGYEFDRGQSFLKNLKIIPYSSSRGCPHACSFCEVQYQPRGIRMKHTINDDIQALFAEHTPDLIFLTDELPPYYSKEWREQLESIRFPFMCYIRADIEPDHLQFLIAHGLKVTAFGIESGSERFRNDVLKKGITDKQIMRTVEILRKNNLRYIPFYMMNIPGETLYDQKITLEMIDFVGGSPIVWQYQDLNRNVAVHAGR